MAKLTNDTNQVQSPVDIAMQMLAGTQDIIFNSIIGPQKTEKVEMIEGQPLDDILNRVVQQAGIQGRSIQDIDVTAPDKPTPMPSPMPIPPDIPNMPDGPSIGQINTNNLSGGGMNNGNA